MRIPWSVWHLWAAAFGRIARPAAEREPLELEYVLTLAKLVRAKRIPFWMLIWAVRARPAWVSGVDGEIPVAHALIHAGDLKHPFDCPRCLRSPTARPRKIPEDHTRR